MNRTDNEQNLLTIGRYSRLIACDRANFPGGKRPPFASRGLGDDAAVPKHRVPRRGRLTPYASNARTHSKKQIRQIAASITEFGFTNPVLIGDDGGIIAGHGRVLAAQ